jgi:hypothetical protein
MVKYVKFKNFLKQLEIPGIFFFNFFCLFLILELGKYNFWERFLLFGFFIIQLILIWIYKKY